MDTITITIPRAMAAHIRQVLQDNVECQASHRVGCCDEEIREIDKEIDVTADARDAIDAAINDGWKP